MKNNPFRFIQGLLCTTLFLGMTASVFAAAAAPKCSAEKAEFRKLYLSLQSLYNYEGTDESLDAKGKLIKKKHDPSEPYKGKVFEDALFLEYQNTLRKVGNIYQAAKFGKDDKNNFKSNKIMIDFLAAIENKDSSSTAYIEKNNIDEVIKELKKLSTEKYSTEADKKFRISDQDEYLLRKLLTHAQDRLCSVQEYEKNGGKDTKFFKADYLKQVRNAPLNRLVNLLKNSNIKDNSEIKIVDTNTTIYSAITEQIKKLSDWMKANKKCQSALTNPLFIQANIQPCNYNKFLETLQKDKVDTLESILHYINANERLLNRPQAIAETSMDELKLEYNIDQTFKTMGEQISCTQVESKDKKSKKIFVRNLPYDTATNKFKTEKIDCTMLGKKLPAAQCLAQFELISDDLGRGIEIRSKKKSKNPVSFSIEGNANCENMSQPEIPQVITPPPVKEPEVKPPPKEAPKEAAKEEAKVDCEKDKENPVCKTVDPNNAKKTECEKKNEEFNKPDADGGQGPPVIKFTWNGKSCDEKKSKKADGKKEVEDEPDATVYPDKAAPPRFQPIQIPTRQVYIMPGMP